MKTLRIGDFKRNGEAGSPSRHYFSHTLEDGREVCLESCLNGYCVGIYQDGELIGEKECTNIPDFSEPSIAPGFSMLAGEALEKAVEIANKKLAE